MYAPPDDDVVCFEPTTAPTNPFRSDGPPSWVGPGESFAAPFTVDVA